MLYSRFVFCCLQLGKSETTMTMRSGDVTSGNLRATPPPLSPFGDYPNPLHITDSDRRSFHPVVKFPEIWIDEDEVLEVSSSSDSTKTSRRRAANYKVQDFSVPTGTQRHLATEEERRVSRAEEAVTYPENPRTAEASRNFYYVGRYDENRVGLYESDLFDDTTNAIDGYSGRRTVHMGIDLAGPVGTPVYAFYQGTIHAAGYNSALGDYGNVIVIRHELSSSTDDGGDQQSNQQSQQSQPPLHRYIYALYGHLSDLSLVGRSVGQPVARGDVVGHLGGIHENGGWLIPHVHFQLSVHPPATHDMPGVVSLRDRSEALVEYPDPRWVLGPLY
jgi:peptidoglycan LD-endopeptidase LytH